MAEIDLRKVYIHDSADNDDFLALFWIDEKEDYGAAGSIRRYSGGRLRSVRNTGAQQNVAFAFPYVSPAELQDLRDRCGQLQMFRDTRGRKLWGVFYAVNVTERPTDTNVRASISVEQVTYVEAV